MGITVETRPIEFSPAYNTMAYILTSTNSGNAGFKYLCDVRILNDDQSWDNVTKITLEKAPDDVTAYGIFDVSRVVEQYLTARGLEYGTSEKVEKMSGNFIVYQPYFYETWTGGSSTYGTDSIRFAWNGVIPFETFPNYSQGTYVAANGGTPQFLTNQPPITKIRRLAVADLYSIGRITSSGVTTHQTISEYEVKTYNSAGTLLGTWRINTPTYGGFADTDSGHYFYRCPSGVANLNQISNTQFISGVQPVITASTATYTIRAKGYYGYMQTQNFTIDDTCTKYDEYHLTFLNALGGFDTFTMYGKSRKNINIQSDYFNASVDRRISPSVGVETYTHKASDRVKTAFSTSYTESYALTSGWITDTEAEWLKEMFSSPIVQWQQAYGTYLAVNIIATNYEIKKHINGDLVMVEANMELSFNRIRQRQ